MDEITNRPSNETTLPSYEPNIKPIRIKYQYAFSSKIPEDLYMVMMYGKQSDYLKFRKSLARTFLLRLLLCLSVMGLIMTGAFYLIIITDTYFNSIFAALVFPGIYIVAQLLWWYHYHRSTKNRHSYLIRNFRLAKKFSIKEHQQRNEFANVFSDHLHLPPTYLVTNSPPPEYV